MTTLTDIIAEDGAFSVGIREARLLARSTFERHGLGDVHREMCKWLRAPESSHPDYYTELWEQVLGHFSGEHPFDLDVAIHTVELCMTLHGYPSIALLPSMSATFRKRLDSMLLTALTIGRCREALRIHLGQKPGESAEWSAGLLTRNAALRISDGERNAARSLNDQLAATMSQKAPRYRRILEMMMESYYRTSEGRAVIAARKQWDLDRGKDETWEPNVDRIRVIIEGRRAKKV